MSVHPQLVLGNEIGDAIAVIFGLTEDQRFDVRAVTLHAEAGKMATVSFEMFIDRNKADQIEELAKHYALTNKAET